MDTSPGLAPKACFWVRIKQTILKLCIWFILTLWKCFKGSCLLNGFPSYIMISSWKFHGTSFVLGSYGILWCLCFGTLGCCLTLLPFSVSFLKLDLSLPLNMTSVTQISINFVLTKCKVITVSLIVFSL